MVVSVIDQHHHVDVYMALLNFALTFKCAMFMVVKNHNAIQHKDRFCKFSLQAILFINQTTNIHNYKKILFYKYKLNKPGTLHDFIKN